MTVKEKFKVKAKVSNSYISRLFVMSVAISGR